jgi:hypothetical protein
MGGMGDTRPNLKLQETLALQETMICLAGNMNFTTAALTNPPAQQRPKP